MAQGHAIFSLLGEGEIEMRLFRWEVPWLWRHHGPMSWMWAVPTHPEHSVQHKQISSAWHCPHDINLVEINNKDADCTNCINIYFKIFLKLKCLGIKYKDTGTGQLSWLGTSSIAPNFSIKQYKMKFQSICLKATIKVLNLVIISLLSMQNP